MSTIMILLAEIDRLSQTYIEKNCKTIEDLYKGIFG